MIVRTVGELRKALENFDDNTPLDLYASCYDRNNYTCIKRDNYRLEGNEPMEISVSLDGSFLKIENDNTGDMELGY